MWVCGVLLRVKGEEFVVDFSLWPLGLIGCCIWVFFSSWVCYFFIQRVKLLMLILIWGCCGWFDVAFEFVYG